MPEKVAEHEVNAIGIIIGFKQRQGQMIAMGLFVPHFLQPHFCLETVNNIGRHSNLLIERHLVSLIFTNFSFFVCC